MNARRKGRPPLGNQATSGAERTRRYRQRLSELGKPSKASAPTHGYEQTPRSQRRHSLRVGGASKAR
jgi:hypothetical protein